MARIEKAKASNRSGSGVPVPDCIVGPEESESHNAEHSDWHPSNPLRRLAGSVIGNVAEESSRLAAVH